MANKAMWDWMDKAEGRKDSSHANMEKEKVRQGVTKKKDSMARKIRVGNDMVKRVGNDMRNK